MPRIVAVCSCPRLGFMDYMGQSIAAFYQNGVEYRNLYGVFWEQVLSEEFRKIVDAGYDYVITTDYDSIYTGEDVAQLIRLAEQNPHANAICAMQMGRFTGLLASNDDGYLLQEELKTKPLVPVGTGHFGLTIIRVSSLTKLEKPWFWSTPDANGDWGREGKTDSDIYFWDNLKECGMKLYLAPRIVIGHLELLIKYPDVNMDGIYQTLKHNSEFGKPSDVWK